MRKINLIFWLLVSLYASSENRRLDYLPTSQKGFSGDITCTISPFYRYRPDDKAGREIVVDFTGEKLAGNAQIEVSGKGFKETTEVAPLAEGRSSCTILLPENIGVKQDAQLRLILKHGSGTIKKDITVPALRHWKVYIYSHSHVDIGYSNTQENVEILHKRNVDEGIKLGEATKTYPDGSKYKWNPEVMWQLERYWQGATPEQKGKVVDAVKKGYLCLDASYLNLNTSVCNDEEMFQVFSFSREMQKLTGVPINTLQQMDIPGMSWGLVPVMAKQGIRYIMSWPNYVRGGNSHSIDEKPFWWIGPDGKSKVLFFQPGVYGNSGSMNKGKETGRPWFGQRDIDKIPAIIKTDSANVNFLEALSKRERPDYPYDFYVVSWSLWDNSPIDADLSDAVKKWNEEYAFPRLEIAGGTDIMKMIDENYGDKLPTVKGDYSEYWTDGLGTAARLTAINRNVKERLIQAETLWTMLRPGKLMPRDRFDDAWRYIALGSEHTFCAENPSEPYFQDAIWKVKQSYFREAEDRTQTLLDEALAPATDKSSGALGPVEGPSNGGVVVFNTHSWAHGGLVTLSKSESMPGDRVTDDQGKEVLSQRLSTGELAFLASDVPAFGSRHYRVIKGNSTITEGCKLNGNTLENKHLSVSVDSKTGNITKLTTRVSEHNFVDSKVNGGLNAFQWVSGESDIAYADSMQVITTTENGPLIVELRIDSKARGCRSVSRSVRLVEGGQWVEISNTVDKLPLIAKDGIHFGFGFDVPNATTRVDIPWGIMEVDKDQWPAANRNWLTLQRWLDISNGEAGVTWCSLDAPLFESGAMTANQTGGWGGERKPWLKKLEPSSTVYSWVMNNHWFTNFPLTQDGPVAFRYRLMPHGAYDAANANRFGLEQAQPLVALAANNNAISKPLVSVNGSPAITVSILKSTTENKTMILRLRSVSSKDEPIKLEWPACTPKSLNICDTEEISGARVTDEITIPARGFVTLKAVW